MQIQYVGPFDAVDLDGVGAVARNATISVPSELAGRAPSPRLSAAMLELTAAMEAIDHHGAAALREEIVSLDAGAGLLAQPSNWVPVKASGKGSADDVE